MTPKQNPIPFPAQPTVNDMVREIMSAGGWFAPWELCRFIQSKYGILVSDSTCTARLRDLRKSRYGAHVIDVRKRSGSRAFEYRLGA